MLSVKSVTMSARASREVGVRIDWRNVEEDVIQD
jgi:hypothetical protein